MYIYKVYSYNVIEFKALNQTPNNYYFHHSSHFLFYTSYFYIQFMLACHRLFETILHPIQSNLLKSNSSSLTSAGPPEHFQTWWGHDWTFSNFVRTLPLTQSNFVRFSKLKRENPQNFVRTFPRVLLCSGGPDSCGLT